MALTPEQITDYIHNPNTCPNCKGNRLSTSETYVDAPKAYSNTECDDCKYTWREVYKLSTVDCFEEGW
jgi:C4-type Zn-finger protein